MQLTLVKEVGGGDGGGGEMGQLLQDLQQLIELTEGICSCPLTILLDASHSMIAENLMEVKKQKLLLMLHPSPSADTAVPEELGGADGEAVVSTTTQQDEIIGMQCRGPLKEVCDDGTLGCGKWVWLPLQSWGGESYHNAIILCMETSNPQVGGCDIELPTPDDPRVRILFTQPLYDAMKPCSYFLEGACKFSELECNFSHGHVVTLSRLRPYMEPDYR